MSLHPKPCPEVPASTAAVARAAFPRGNPYLRLRDALGTVFSDAQFAPLFSSRGQPAEVPWRLALVTVLQFAENLSDRRAAEAVRGRVDWKYLLGLEVAGSGFDASVLNEFRTRLLTGGAEAVLLDTLLALCREHKLLVARGRQRTDSTHVLGAVRALNRLGCAIETLRAALNALAVAAPAWLRTHADPTWPERYAKSADEVHIPKGGRAARLRRADRARRARAARRHHGLGCARLAARGPGSHAPAASVGADLLPRTRRGRRRWRSECSRIGQSAGLLAHIGRGVPARVAADRLALRPRHAFRPEALNHLDRLQGARDGNLRRGAAASRHPRRDYAGADCRPRHPPTGAWVSGRQRSAAGLASGRCRVCGLGTPGGQRPQLRCDAHRANTQGPAMASQNAGRLLPPRLQA